MGLQTNSGKTVVMVYHPFQALGNPTTAAYRRRITGEGQSYREKLRAQVACKERGNMLEVGSLSSNLMTQHGRASGRRREWTNLAAVRVPQVYRVSFPENGDSGNAPWKGAREEWR